MTPKKTPTPASGSKAKKTKTPVAAQSYTVSFYHDWCKKCGLCMAFCPKKIIKADKNGKPEMTDAGKCTGCRFCEMHCPDFAITVESTIPRRRKTDE